MEDTAEFLQLRKGVERLCPIEPVEMSDSLEGLDGELKLGVDLVESSSNSCSFK